MESVQFLGEEHIKKMETFLHIWEAERLKEISLPFADSLVTIC